MAMAVAVAMAMPAANMLHRPGLSTCRFPRSVVASRRVEATSSPSSAPPASVEEDEGPNLPCGTCDSKGWLLCDFCKGQKTNVQVRANKFYRRCPSCRAVGVVICPQCKVFKCVSFPDGVDGY